MNPLEPSPGLLLDYLYGLLDDAERQQVEDLLKTVPAWQQALAEARQQQQLLGEAAKTSFAGVRFTPPAPRTLQLEAAATQTARRRPRLRAWAGWAAAAAVVLAVVGGGLTGAVGWLERQYAVAGKETDVAALTYHHDEQLANEEKARQQTLDEM